MKKLHTLLLGACSTNGHPVEGKESNGEKLEEIVVDETGNTSEEEQSAPDQCRNILRGEKLLNNGYESIRTKG